MKDNKGDGACEGLKKGTRSLMTMKHSGAVPATVSE